MNGDELIERTESDKVGCGYIQEHFKKNEYSMKDFHVTRWRRERQPIKQNLWRRLRPELCAYLSTIILKLANMSNFEKF